MGRAHRHVNAWWSRRDSKGNHHARKQRSLFAPPVQPRAPLVLNDVPSSAIKCSAGQGLCLNKSCACLPPIHVRIAFRIAAMSPSVMSARPEVRSLD
eukprot:809563-Alexandrium_andersonii.AAC.2